MKLLHGLYNFMGILILFFFLILLRTSFINTENVISAYRLQYACDYATEAAFSSIVRSSNLDINYKDLSNVRLEPKDCLKVFEDILGLNYNMPVGKTTRNFLENYIVTGILSTRDGYYVLEPVVNTTGGQNLKWSMKRAFIENKSGINIINILDNSYINLVFNNGSITFNEGKNYSFAVSKEKFLTDNVAKIMNDINYQIYKRSLGQNKYTFYFPPLKDLVGNRGFDKPTLVMFLQGFNYDSLKELNTATLFGYRITKKVMVLGYLDSNGRKKYCYEGLLPDNLRGNIQEVFSSDEDAVKAGYKPDFVLLQSYISSD